MRRLVPLFSAGLILTHFGCTPDRGEGNEPPPPSGDLGTGGMDDLGDDSTGGDSGSDSGSEDDGGNDWPDVGTTGDCNPLLQDCPDGQKCTAASDGGGGAWTVSVCVDVTGSGAEGDPCTASGGGTDDCAEGLICMNTGPDGSDVCVAFCQGTERTCSASTTCAVYNSGVLPICLSSCDPVMQNCPAGQGCIDTPQGRFVCFTDSSGGGGAEGEMCPDADGENLCDPGLWCGSGRADCASLNCCTPYCNVNEANTCTAPNECVSFYGDPAAAPAGYAHVGVCIAP